MGRLLCSQLKDVCEGSSCVWLLHALSESALLVMNAQEIWLKCSFLLSFLTSTNLIM